jgi:hypothetical protein
MVGAAPHTTAPTTNAPVAIRNARRIPARRTTTELPALPRIEPTAYAVEAHA